jgi:hypothetical protein
VKWHCAFMVPHTKAGETAKGFTSRIVTVSPPPDPSIGLAYQWLILPAPPLTLPCMHPNVAREQKLTKLLNEHADPAHFHQRLYLENMVGDLVNCLGQCERILSTPLPLAYSRHTRSAWAAVTRPVTQNDDPG